MKAPRQPEALRDERRPRLTVVGTTYYAPAGGDAICIDSGFSRWLDTKEQPCVRKLTIGEEWTALDGIWLRQSSQVVIANDEGKYLTVNTTPEERTAIAARVLLVSSVEAMAADVPPLAVVRPGEDARFEPGDLTALRLRCWSGTAKITVAVFPR